MPTVAEVLGEGLPPGSIVRGGAGGLTRDLSWATVIRPHAPSLAVLRGGELALLSLTALAALPGLAAPVAVQTLADASVSAIGFVGPCDAETEAVAQAAEVPLIELPTGLSLRAIEAAVNRFLAERRHDSYTAAHSLHAELTRLALDGTPLPDLLPPLAARTHRWCAVLTPDFTRRNPALTPRSALVPSPLSPAPTPETLHRAAPIVLRWADSFGEFPAEPPVCTVPLGRSGAALLCAPLVHSGRLDGFLALYAHDVVREADALAVARGASACAIALSRERAGLEAADQLRGDFLTDLRSPDAREELILERAHRLGYALDRPHAPIALAPATTERVQGTVARLARDLRAPVGPGSSATLVLLPVRSDVGLEADAEARREAARLQLEIADGSERPCVGLGRAGVGLSHLRRGLGEAEQALGLGRRLFGPGRVTHFVDLGLYRLLGSLVAGGDLAAFREEHLGALETYDRDAGANLIETLRAYYAARCSPTVTARQLHLHRNSLLYRLQRIRDIAGIDPDDPGTRLLLEVALHARDLLDANLQN